MRGALATVGLALGLGACSQPAEDVWPVADELAADLIDGRWATRKLAQRTLVLGGDAAVAEDLMLRAVEADERDAHRWIAGALAADPAQALRTAGAIVGDEARPLQGRFVIARAVARRPEAGAVSPQLAGFGRTLMRDGTDRLHLEVGVRLLALHAPEEAAPVIAEALAQPDKAHRKAGAAALTDAPLPGGLPLVLDLVDAEEVYLRRRGVAALALYPDDAEAVAALERTLRDETDARVCTRAVEAVEGLAPEQASAVLLDRLAADDGCGPGHRYAVLSSLRRVLRAHPQPDVEAHLRSGIDAAPEPGLAGYLAAAVGDVELAASLPPVGAYDGLTELTSRRNEPLDTRLAAIDALADLDATGTTQRLEALLDVDAEPEQVRAVLVALERTGREDPGRGFLAIPFTGDAEDPALRELAIARLRRSTDPQSVERLRVVDD